MTEQAWPEPSGGWKDVEDIGDVMTDDEIRALGFEPTSNGWRLLKPVPPAAPTEGSDGQQELLEGLRERLRKRQYG